MYEETERGKGAWKEVGARIDILLRQYSGDGTDSRRLEDALTAAGEAGMEQGFMAGARFIMELFTEAML